MPQDKNTRVRHSILDYLFRNYALSIDELLERVNYELELKGRDPISIRTLRNDINTFEYDYYAEFIPEQKSGKKRLYSYVDKNFYAIKSRELSDNEKKLIRSGLTIIEQIESLPGNINFEKIKLELSELVNYDPDSEPVIYYQNNPYLRGLDLWWRILYDAIKSKTVLKIHYKDFENKEFEFIVSPYALKEYNLRWYLICWNNRKNTRYYNIAIDRIENITRIDNEPFIENTSDIEEYYEQAVGITVLENQPKEKVVFIASGLTAKYLYSKPLHPLAKYRWLSDCDLQITLEVVINYELEHLLLSYADSIKIIEPQSLVERHKELLRKSLAKY